MKHGPMSESLIVGLLLALAGGMLDAYSFINRGEVFATAETGNIVQLSVHLSMGEWASAFQYLLPILAFILGVVAAEAIRRRAEGRTGRLQWQQYLLLAECGVLAAVSLLPQGPLDPLANILISFTTELLFRFFALPDPQSGTKASVYYRLILCFVLGAVLCGRLSLLFGPRTVLAACVPLLAAFFLMFRLSPEEGAP